MPANFFDPRSALRAQIRNAGEGPVVRCDNGMVNSPERAAGERPDGTAWFDRHLLAMKAVQVRPLDEHGAPIAVRGGAKTASGFIRRDATGLFLYVCWHTVSGLDRNDLRIPPPPVILPKALLVRLQNVQEIHNGELVGWGTGNHGSAVSS